MYFFNVLIIVVIELVFVLSLLVILSINEDKLFGFKYDVVSVVIVVNVLFFFVFLFFKLRIFIKELYDGFFVVFYCLIILRRFINFWYILLYVFLRFVDVWDLKNGIQVVLRFMLLYIFFGILFIYLSKS